MMGLLPSYAETEGQILLDGKDILDMPPAELSKLRGGEISMIFQEPMAALDPVYTIGEQIAETIVQHEGIGHRAANAGMRLGVVNRTSDRHRAGNRRFRLAAPCLQRDLRRARVARVTFF